MVVNDSDHLPTVQMVAGSGLAEGAWDLALAIGDGNAGRAVKRRAMRIYDREKAADKPLEYVYKPVKGMKPHLWLMSVPLFSSSTLACGVVNVGTFQKTGVRLPRTLEIETKSKELAKGFQHLVEETLDLIRSRFGEAIHAGEN